MSIKLIKDPFMELDLYRDEAFSWAQQVADNIEPNEFDEKDPLIISSSFVWIFGSFIYLSMGIMQPYLEEYLAENVHDNKDDAWESMMNCVPQIYKLLQKTHNNDSYQIYLTLYDSILLELPDELENHDSEVDKIEPYNFNPISGLGFVQEGFLW